MKSGGSPASFINVSIGLPLIASGSSCTNRVRTPFAVENGKLDARFAAGELTPPVPDSPGAIVTLCGFVNLRAGATGFAIGDVPNGG